MRQVRFNYEEANVKVSIYLGLANSLTEARQVVIDKIDEMDLLVNGQFLFDGVKFN